MKINLEDLKKKADFSRLEESYTTLEANDEYRIGFGFKRGSESASVPFIELVMTLCPSGEPNLEKLESRIKLLKAIEERGYKLTCEDDGTFSCEAFVTEAHLERELEALCELLNFIRELNERPT